MTAAYRMRGLGWFLAVVIVTLGFYLVSLQVAAERKKVDDIDRDIAQAERDIRSLETEFNTRANLAQLEKWNGDVLALAAPTADQFLPDEARLAQIDFRNPGSIAPRNANYVVPSLPVDAGRPPVAPTGEPAPAPAPVPAPSPPGAVGLAANDVAPKVARVIKPAAVRPQDRITIAEAQTPIRPHRSAAVAMLDRHRLNDTTLSDLLSRADISVGTAR